jgi:hypothetical protein
VRLYHQNLKRKFAGPPVYYSGSNEPTLVPEFESPDNTFVLKVFSRFELCPELVSCPYL